MKRCNGDQRGSRDFGTGRELESQVLGGGASGWRAILDAGQLPVQLAQLR